MFGAELLAGIAVLGICCTVYGMVNNHRRHEMLKEQGEELADVRTKAEDLLSRAKHIATMSAIEQPFAVCEACNQIRTRYIRDENGITCIECAEKHQEQG